MLAPRAAPAKPARTKLTSAPRDTSRRIISIWPRAAAAMITVFPRLYTGLASPATSLTSPPRSSQVLMKATSPSLARSKTSLIEPGAGGSMMLVFAVTKQARHLYTTRRTRARAAVKTGFLGLRTRYSGASLGLYIRPGLKRSRKGGRIRKWSDSNLYTQREEGHATAFAAATSSVF